MRNASRAGGLAREVDNLKDLIAKLEQGLDPQRANARGRAIGQPAGAFSLPRSRTISAGCRFRFLARTSSDSG